MLYRNPAMTSWRKYKDRNCKQNSTAETVIDMCFTCVQMKATMLWIWTETKCMMSEGGEVWKGDCKYQPCSSILLGRFFFHKHLGEYKLNSNKVGTEMIEMFSLSQSSFKMDWGKLENWSVVDDERRESSCAFMCFVISAQFQSLLWLYGPVQRTQISLLARKHDLYWSCILWINAETTQAAD